MARPRRQPTLLERQAAFTSTLRFIIDEVGPDILNPVVCAAAVRASADLVIGADLDIPAMSISPASREEVEA